VFAPHLQLRSENCCSMYRKSETSGNAVIYITDALQ
jgi:hypothetical protein